MIHEFDLTLGLPHTNHRFLSEHLLLKYAGHFQWQAIAAAAGVPLSTLRTSTGGEVYASFYYIEVRIPDIAPLESFRLDETLHFAIGLRAFKNIALEGRVVFDRMSRMTDRARVERAVAPSHIETEFPFIQFANIFITPEKGNSRLRVAPPAQADFRDLPPLPNEENPYQFTRAASETGELGLFDESWSITGTHEHSYAIDIDRDTNGAGLVYFANYIAFMDSAERFTLNELFGEELRAGLTERSLRHRRIGYYGNADVYDSLEIRVTLLRREDQPHLFGFRYTIRRGEDAQTICLSESIKTVPAHSSRN